MSKDKIMILGANDFQDQLVLKAKELGYEVHLAAWEEGAVAKEHADKFYPISIADKDAILQAAKEIQPKGIISIASDLAVPTVNYAANELGLTANSNRSSELSTNKYSMRKKFMEKGLPCPKFKLVDINYDFNALDMDFPLIVKPIDRSGSRGICKVYSAAELKNAVKNALEVSFCENVLIEEFAEGREFSMEMISFKGEHHFLALTQKFTTGAPNFIETMHIQPAVFDEELKIKAIETMKKALDALEVEYGASHSEFKVDGNNNLKIIEIGARMGGDCIGSDLVEISTGYDFKEMVLDAAVGKAPDFEKKHKEQSTACIKFIFNEEDLEILKEIQQKHPEKIYRVSKIEPVGKSQVTDSSTRFGYFILKCSSHEECLDLVRYKEDIEVCND